MAAKRGKRADGEGTAFKRADGRYTVRVMYKDTDGRTRYKEFTRETQGSALTAAREFRRKLATGERLFTARQTLAQFLDNAWLPANETRRPGTRMNYSYNARRISKVIGHVPLGELNGQHVQYLVNQLSKQYAPRTVQRARDVLRNALNDAIRWGLISKNATAGVKLPTVEKYRPQILTPAQVRQFLTANADDRLEAIYRLGLLGLRRGEALGLRWKDLDLAAGTLTVAVSLQYIDKRLVLVPPKTPESRRTLHLPASVQAALERHRRRQERERQFAGGRWQDHGLVFCTTVGTPIAPRNLLRSLRDALERAGLPRMRFHDLRHSCATMLAAEGVPPKTAQKILGHSDVRTTLAIYTHVLEDDEKAAAAVLDRLLGSIEPAGEERS